MRISCSKFCDDQSILIVNRFFVRFFESWCVISLSMQVSMINIEFQQCIDRNFYIFFVGLFLDRDTRVELLEELRMDRGETSGFEERVYGRIA